MASGANMLSFGLRGLLWRIIKPVFALFLKRLYSRVRFMDNGLLIQRGILVRRRTYIGKDGIRCFCIDYGPIMRMFGLCSVSIVARGETKGIDSRVWVLPLCSMREANFVEKCLKEQLLSQKQVLRCSGERFYKKRTVLFVKEDIGAVFLSAFVFSKKCSLKFVLYSNKRTVVKLYGIKREKAVDLFDKAGLFE